MTRRGVILFCIYNIIFLYRNLPGKFTSQRPKLFRKLFPNMAADPVSKRDLAGI